jgi:hypothetical protein
VVVVSKVVTNQVPVIVVKKAVTGKLMHEADGKPEFLRYISSLPLNSNLFETMARIIFFSPAMRRGNLDMKVKFINSRLRLGVQTRSYAK